MKYICSKDNKYVECNNCSGDNCKYKLTLEDYILKTLESSREIKQEPMDDENTDQVFDFTKFSGVLEDILSRKQDILKDILRKSIMEKISDMFIPDRNSRFIPIMDEKEKKLYVIDGTKISYIAVQDYEEPLYKMEIKLQNEDKITIYPDSLHVIDILREWQQGF